MPSYQQFRLPDVGEGLTEADIVTWSVAEGDTVAVNQQLCEIETAKSVVELPSPYAGQVHQLLVPEGTTVEVGAPIVVIDVDPGGPAPDGGAAPASAEPSAAAGSDDGGTGDGGAGEGADSSGSVLVGYGTRPASVGRRPRRSAVSHDGAPAAPARDSRPQGSAPAVPASASSDKAPAVTSPRTVPAASTPGTVPAASTPRSPSPAGSASAPRSPSPAGSASAPSPAGPGAVRVLAKPPVRKLAKDLGVDLTTVGGSGPGGIITREDVMAQQARTEAQPLATYPGDEEPWLEGGTVSADGRQTRVPARSVRKRTAEAMVASAFTAPHVTVFHTVDVTRTMKLVERLKQGKEFADVHVTPLLIVMKAFIHAVRRHPEVNASWDNATNEIVYKHYMNLGIAAATPRGLVVPNIKNANRMKLHELAVALGELTAKARAGKTSPQDMSDGTISITNVGVFGIDTGTPILNPGESVILAFGAIRRQPWVHKGQVKPRWVTQLALSMDHRLVDGGLGARVLADVAKVLEDPSQALVWS
ncbi:pyruvate dehydrogenase E2 component (dihydrolipoamide acetyltransferase) [Georgenia soli]|uniref:Dihydrolipoamide acetyltransferase component of pyruvate dehydrogenase complex n=1 Tax=Georgenia soli TaxID=638953 RepID=A0A2A9EMA5_9MICO|nr:dihydrolipoamide acetyltransferase family protein [Georgenia soli]PFG40048.1 pyruvate dehydrogenase E2 component (dihydrolipoamide acetyltransferase) [Georgenia soli]